LFTVGVRSHTGFNGFIIGSNCLIEAEHKKLTGQIDNVGSRLNFFTDDLTLSALVDNFLTDESTMLVPAPDFLTNELTMLVPATEFLTDELDNVGSSP
jgi:hypothetical protein